MRQLDGITDSVDGFEQALGDGEGQGTLACCSPWGSKELDTTEQLNNSKISEMLASWCKPFLTAHYSPFLSSP